MPSKGTKTTDSQNDADAVASRLRRDIFSGIRLPRERLVETSIAEAFSVSRMVIRQVLSNLEKEGLVVIESYKGASVADISLDLIYENYQIIAMMQGYAAYLSATRLAPQDLLALETLLKAQKKIGADNVKEWQILNHKFHSAINLACGSSKLIQLIRQHSQFTSFWFLVLSSPGRIPIGIAGHAAVLEALKKRDPQQSRILIEKHIIEAGKYLIDSTKENLPIGVWIQKK